MSKRTPRTAASMAPPSLDISSAPMIWPIALDRHGDVQDDVAVRLLVDGASDFAGQRAADLRIDVGAIAGCSRDRAASDGWTAAAPRPNRRCR
jgi:hypothetical protein